MKYNRAKTIDFFVNEINSGKMEFSDVRKNLEQKNIDDKEIVVVVRQVDKEVQRLAALKASQSIGRNLFYGGLLLCFIGIILTVGTYLSIIDIGPYFIIATGPIFGGLILAMTGKSKMKRI